MRYSRLAEYYERLEGTTKRLEMTDVLVELLKEADADELPAVLHLTRGALAPDFEGIEVGLADKLVIRALSFTTGMPEEHVTALYRETGDLGDAAEKALAGESPRTLPAASKSSAASKSAPMAKRAAARQTTLFAPEAREDEPLRVLDVFAALREIAEASGAGSQERKLVLLEKLLLRADAAGARYIVRTITGKLRLGVADMTLLDALALAFATKEDRAAIERAYNVTSDIARVAKVLVEGGVDAVSTLRLTVGVPIRPMLAERLPDAAAIMEKLGGVAAAEVKYDGLRAQAHVFPASEAGGKRHVRLFSRRLEDITDQFPDVQDALAKAVRATSAVIEGEIVAVEPGTGEMRPFQEVSQRRGRKHDLERLREEIPVALVLFDCLLADDEDVTSKPLQERRAILENAVAAAGTVEGVRFSRYEVVHSTPDLERFFDEALAEGGEGVMVKSIAAESGYRAGARGWQWIKFKRDYAAALSDTIDLVVVGAFAGRGRRAGWHGALLMAAYNPEEDVFETVCKLGTGFDDAELARMTETFRDAKLEHRHPRVRSTLEADDWFEPVHVAEVLGFELTLSPTHTAARDVLKPGAGLAVRFPRFTGRWRTDKQAEAATTTTELVEMYRAQARGPAAE